MYKPLTTILALTTLVMPSTHIIANENDQALSNILEIETDNATKTKLNADYVPGMGSVLHGDELARLGIDNVWQALQLIPGIHISMSQQGDRQVVARGLGGEFLSPELKMLIDDNPVHNALLGYGPAFYMPISMVERIEVIRGPGSALYGDYAFAGVINIVSRKHDNAATLQYSSFNTRQGTATLSGNSDDGRMHYSLLASAYKTDGANPPVAADAIGQSGNADKRIDSTVTALDFSYDKTELYAKFINIFGGNHYGLTAALEPLNNRGGFDANDTMLGIRQGIALADGIDLSIHGDYSTYRNQARYTLRPPAFQIEVFYKERNYQAGTELSVSRFENHRLLLGAEYRESKPLEIWQDINFIIIPPLYIPIPTTRLTGASNWIKEGIGRISASFYAQDQYAITPSLTLTTGVRHERFNDVGNSFNPRIAMVYNLGDVHLFKAQFSRAFRPPTLYELHENGGSGNPSLMPETMNNFEVGYIFTKPEQVLRATLFHSRVKNLISRLAPVGPSAPQFINLPGRATLNGMELEYEHKLGEQLHSNLNLAYTKTNDGGRNQPLAGSANLLANVRATWQPSHGYSLSAWGHYVGKRNRAYNDNRPKLAADTTLDIAIAAENQLISGLSLRAGIKNVFNRNVQYPAPPVMPGDYSGDPRSIWTRIDYIF